MKATRCPVEGCDYWACFGGHLAPFLKAFYRHVEKNHSDRTYLDTRRVGGIIDRHFGDAIQGAFSYETMLAQKCWTLEELRELSGRWIRGRPPRSDAAAFYDWLDSLEAS